MWWQWRSAGERSEPERIAAIWLRSGSALSAWRKGEIPEIVYPPAAFAVPMMCNPGVKERGDKRFNGEWTGAIDTLAFFRERNALGGFAPDPASGHECGDSRYLAIAFFDVMLAARLPAAAATATLSAVDMRAAWGCVVDGDCIPGAAVPLATLGGSAAAAAWPPNEAFAALWSQYVRDGFVVNASPPPAPARATATRAADGSVIIAWSATTDPQTGLAGFIIKRQTREGIPAGTTEAVRLPDSPKPRFGRPLFQGVSHGDTPIGPLAGTRWVDVGPAAAAATGYTIATVNAAGVASPPLAIPVP
ncbi:MAG: hypothetical protein HQ464_04155 [Planctomycetes bacterium]|nr:hypothetical protein [Planctomycetota bacterium]